MGEAVWKKMPRMEAREELGTWGETSLRKEEVWSDLKQSGVSDNLQGVRDCRSLTGVGGQRADSEAEREPGGLLGLVEETSICPAEGGLLKEELWLCEIDPGWL